MKYLIFSNRGGGDYSRREDLDLSMLLHYKPNYIFFPFWSWIISPEIYDVWTCIGFHMTDLPYGRGGSPLQNLIIRGHKMTKISAFRIVEGLDAGPIYLKRDFDISYASADEIYDRALKIILEDMIPYIVKQRPNPVPQVGKVVEFERWRCSEADILRAMDTNYENLGQ